MKKRRILIGSIAGVLALVTLGVTIAEYAKVDEAITIGITGSTQADGTLSLNDTTVADQKLTPDSDYVVQYQLLNKANTAYTQDTTVADLSITITADDPTALDYIDVTGSIEGYGENTYFKNRLSGLTFEKGEDSITCTYSKLAFKNKGDQSIKFTLSTKDPVQGSTAVDEFIEKLAETTFTYEVTLTPTVATDEIYYISGSFDDNNYQLFDKYTFVPNIDFTDREGALKEFVYKGLYLEAGDVFKVRLNDGTWTNYINEFSVDSQLSDLIEQEENGNRNIIVKEGGTGTYDIYYTYYKRSEDGAQSGKLHIAKHVDNSAVIE